MAMGIRKYSEEIKRTRRGSPAMDWERRSEGNRRRAQKIFVEGYFPVLDVGCGDAHLNEAMTELGIESVGIDMDFAQLGTGLYRACESDISLKLVQSDARYLPFRDGVFGRVESRGMLMMTPYVFTTIYGVERNGEQTDKDVYMILEEVRRVVRDGGRVRIVTMSDREVSEPTYFKPSIDGFAKMCGNIGLECVSTAYLDPNEGFFETVLTK